MHKMGCNGLQTVGHFDGRWGGWRLGRLRDEQKRGEKALTSSDAIHTRIKEQREFQKRQNPVIVVGISFARNCLFVWVAYMVGWVAGLDWIYSLLKHLSQAKTSISYRQYFNVELFAGHLFNEFI